MQCAGVRMGLVKDSRVRVMGGCCGPSPSAGSWSPGQHRSQASSENANCVMIWCDVSQPSPGPGVPQQCRVSPIRRRSSCLPSWDHTLLHTSSVSVNIDWVKKKSSIKVFLRLTEVLSGGGVLVARVRRVAKTLPGQILSLPGSFWQQTSV